MDCRAQLPGTAASMMFQLEVADVAHGVAAAKSESTVDRIKHLCLPRTHYERQLRADVAQFCGQLAEESTDDGRVDIVDLACMLSSVGHNVKVRSALGGGQNRFKNLYHEFLLVKGMDDSTGQEVVVECGFSEHFTISSPSAEYEKILESVPAVFIGTVYQLAPLVELITQHVSDSFAEHKLTMPPWRSARSVMSKWAPQRALDQRPGDLSLSRGCSPRVAWTPRRSTANSVDSTHDGHEPSSYRAPAVGSAVGSVDRTERVKRAPDELLKQPGMGHGSPVLAVHVGFDFPAKQRLAA